MQTQPTEQERRAREFTEARAAFILAALRFAESSTVLHADSRTVEMSAPLDRYNRFAETARAYRLAEVGLVKR
jgi:hypothetical protein